MARARPGLELDEQGLPKPLKWKPMIRVGSLVSGLFFGLGMAVLMQQYAVTTFSTTGLILWILIGLVVGVAIPSIVYAFAVMRTNKAIARRRATPSPTPEVKT